MKEYVCRIVSRDTDKPLAETEIIEFGTPATDAAAFSRAVATMAEMLKLNGTPEKTREWMIARKEVMRIKKEIFLG